MSTLNQDSQDLLNSSTVLEDSLNHSQEEESLDLSIVVPVYNEEESLPDLLERIVTSLKETGLRYEIICVDDGSTKDGSAKWLKDKALTHPNLKAVLLRRNYGQ
ncbi:glycosyltransferase, partial [Oscillatoriales cyanobacterium LEGE 11467]|nr:glycosyltransferase [Zarconia navalis LEGE 11467]